MREIAYKRAMKLQGQPKIDNPTDSILGENFVARRKPLWDMKRLHLPGAETPVHKALVLGVFWLVLCTTIYVTSLFVYAPAFRDVAGIRNPISAVQDVTRRRDEIRALEKGYVEGMDRVQTAMKNLAELRSTQAMTGNPILVAVKSIRDGRSPWDSVLLDIDAAAKKTVESNDILQRIVVGAFSFDEDQKQGSISKVKVYANGDQSSLALAARYLQALEAASSLKDIKSNSATTQQETASGAVLTYSPLDITLNVQKEAEVTTKDPDQNIKDVKDEIYTLFNK